MKSKGGDEQNRCPINACPFICYLPELQDNPEYFGQKRTLPKLKETHPHYKDVYSDVLQQKYVTQGSMSVKAGGGFLEEA